jgi:hypothetical protein
MRWAGFRLEKRRRTCYKQGITHMKTKAAVSLLALLLAGCASQPVRFSGRTPDISGTPAESVWTAQLQQKASIHWYHNAAVVRAVRGTVAINGDSGAVGSRVGSRLEAGSRIHTGNNSVTDLFLGDNGPVLRVTENATVHLVRLDLWRRADERIVDTMIEVEQGQVLGNVKKLSAESSYLLKTKGGVIRIRGTEFAVHANGECKIVSGSAEVFAPGGTFMVTAGEKFTPDGGVTKLTPDELPRPQYLASLSR